MSIACHPLVDGESSLTYSLMLAFLLPTMVKGGFAYAFVLASLPSIMKEMHMEIYVQKWLRLL